MPAHCDRRQVIVGLGALLAMRELRAQARSLDVAYVNGRLWTQQRSAATAFGVIGERIAAVGTDAEVRGLAARNTRIIDLSRRLRVPGFIDNHTHFVRAAITLDMPDLRDSEESRRIRQPIGGVGSQASLLASWLQGGYWDDQTWGGELPARSWIDTGDS